MIQTEKIPLIAAFVAVLLVGVASWLVQDRIAAGARIEVGQSLSTVLETTHQAVSSWMKQNKAAATIWANSLEVRLAAQQLLATPRSRDALLGSPVQAELRSWFQPIQTAAGYLGYFIIGPDNINLASSRDLNIGVESLLVVQEEFLRKVWSGEPAISLPEKSDVPLPGRDGQLQEGLPTMFVGAPILDANGAVIAVFTFRIDPAADFTTILQRGRIGSTGETYAFDRRGLLISDSRFDEQLRIIGLIAADQHAILNVELHDPGVDLLQGRRSGSPVGQQALTRMAASATAGESGMDLEGYPDYRGVPVVGAWRWDPALGFGIATELDVDEAFHRLEHTQQTIFALSVMVALLFLGMAAIYTLYRQRKRAERGVRDREERIRLLLESAPDAMVVINRQGEIVLVNARSETLFGYTRQELIGQAIEVLVPGHLREHHAAHRKAFFANPKAGAMGAGSELLGLRKDGSLVPVEVSLSPFETEGELLVLSAVRDITERKAADQALRESESRFRQLAEYVHEVFWITSADGHEMIYVSPAYEEIWGRATEDLYRDPENWIAAIHPRDKGRVAEAFFSGVAKGEFDEEYRVIRPDGSERWIRDRGFPVLDEFGKVYRIAGIAEDITSSKTDQEELQQARERLEARVRERTAELERTNRDLTKEMAERANAEEQARLHQAELAHMARLNTMGEMATGIAHELNQPLSAIATYAGVGLRMVRAGIEQPDKLAEALEGVHDQAVRAGDIIRHLRQLVSKQPAQKTDVDLNQLVRQVVDFSQAETRKPDIRLVLQLGQNLPRVPADGIQIEQVLLNLVRNAVEAMQHSARGPKQVTIRTRLDGESGVRVAVADTGPGVDAETLQRVFEPFVTTKGARGMGMGLSISRSIIEAHGGRLWVESRSGEGATFFFTLPTEAA